MLTIGAFLVETWLLAMATTGRVSIETWSTFAYKTFADYSRS